jgi:hypothetical protein
LPDKFLTMTTVLRVNMNDIDEKLLRQWKAMYGSSMVELRILGDSNEEEPLTETEFWAVIDAFDWAQDAEEDILKPAQDHLATLSAEKIKQFQDILAYKLWQLDGQAFAATLMEQDGHLSVDDFLYVRCAVVADGKETFENVLQHPEKMPIEYTFEGLLYLAENAYEQKTGEEMDSLPKYNYETYQNREAWGKE